MRTEQQTLFNVEYKPIKVKPRSKYQRWKWENKYRKAKENSNKKCKNCIHLLVNLPSHITGKGKYYKCELLGCSSSSATDVRLSCVCELFEEYTGSEEE